MSGMDVKPPKPNMPTPDVNIPPVSNGGEPAPVIVPPVVVPPVTPPAQPGEKTDPALLLKSLQEERAIRKDLEAELLDLRAALASGDTSSEEVKVLKTQISTLESTLVSMQNDQAIKDLHAKHPALKDKAAEFETYRNLPENKGMALSTAAKSFLTENGLLEAPAPRKGLETPSGGGRQEAPQGWTHATMDEVRKSDFRKYTKLLKEGAFKDLL
jgi:hypothetical protein